MDINDTNYTTDDNENLQETEPELSHSDKLAGIFTEPAKTFDSIAKHPLRTIDWLLPVSLLFLVLAIGNVLLMQNPRIAADLKDKQIAQIEKSFDDQVSKGKMTREQADEQLSAIEDKMDMGSPMIMIATVLSIIIFGFVFFFLISGIYFLFSKYLLKGDGTYQSALVANGLSAYIGIIQVLISTTLAFVFGRMLGDTSVASLMNLDKSTFTGMLLSKLDVLTIWAMIILSIGLSRLFNSKDTVKYIIMIFGLWILWSLLIFFGSQAFPFLSSFQR